MVDDFSEPPLLTVETVVLGSEDEARTLIREAMTLSGDIQITGTTVHLRLDPASAPRRSRALAALCDQLTATETIYPDTKMKIQYSVKGHRGTS